MPEETELRPTPETDAKKFYSDIGGWVAPAVFAATLEHQRDRLLEALEDTKPLLVGIESDQGEPSYRRERAKRLLRAFESALTGAKGAK